MSFTRTAAFAIAAAFAFCLPAQAAPKLMDAISANDLAAMFNAHGIHAKARVNHNGVPTVDMDIVLFGKEHKHSEALLHDCRGHGVADACRIILYYGTWRTAKPVPLAKINAYNFQYYLGKVASHAWNVKGRKRWELSVTFLVSLAGGVTANHIGASLFWWTHAVENVADKLHPKRYRH